MGEQIQTVGGFKVVAFKIEPMSTYVRQGNKMVQVAAHRVRLWLDRTGGAAPESTVWADRHCADRKFTTVDGARRNVLRAFGHIMER